MRDFTVRCNDTARQKKPQERSCEIFLIYFDSGSSLSLEEIEFAIISFGRFAFLRRKISSISFGMCQPWTILNYRRLGAPSTSDLRGRPFSMETDFRTLYVDPGLNFSSLRRKNQFPNQVVHFFYKFRLILDRRRSAKTSVLKYCP